MDRLRADQSAAEPQDRGPTHTEPSRDSQSTLRYVPSDKHKRTPTRGVKGRICPPHVDAQALIDESETHPAMPGKRFATDGERCYAAHPDARGGWHGWPCSRQEVPEQLWRSWIKTGKLKRSKAH
jgi:hypothetical protein